MFFSKDAGMGVTSMVRDGVVNIVSRLSERGCEPRRVGPDLWEAHCPAHGRKDHALTVSRNEFNHVLLQCRAPERCPHSRIIRALAMTNEQVYAETPALLIGSVSRSMIEPSRFGAPLALAAINLPAVNEAPTAMHDETRAFGWPAPAGPSEGLNNVGTLPATPFPAAELMLASPAESPGPPAPPANVSLDAAMSALAISEQARAKFEHKNAVQVLSRLTSTARLFRSADGRFCAQVPVGDRLEIYGLKSSGFRDWLINGYLRDQPEPPSSWAIRRVVGMLEARARFHAGIPELFVRVGQDGDGEDAPYFLDLGDAAGRAVAIDERGWELVARPPVHFRRPEGLLPLPVPVHNGTIYLLRPYINLGEADFRLMIAWLTAALRPVGPYPILVLNGEQASGKSTLARILRLLIDPQACPVLALPKSTHDLMATALNGWLLVYENISSIADWLSDAVCQLAFGGGFASRTLFTNDERSVIYAQRPVILVGIDDFVVRADLRDRSVFMNLAAIPHSRRRTERGFWPAFRADYPRILGGVLDAIVGGLHALPSVELKELPRMADFAEWGEATSRGLGWGTETFGATYNTNRKDATEALLEDSEVAEVVLAMGKIGVNWAASPQVVYERITRGLDREARPKWPKSPSMFGAELRRIAPQLRLHGISVDFRRRNGKRIVTLKTDGTTAERPLADCEPS
jgi:hypothetical protein